jgi:hypothetical protein
MQSLSDIHKNFIKEENEIRKLRKSDASIYESKIIDQHSVHLENCFNDQIGLVCKKELEDRNMKTQHNRKIVFSGIDCVGADLKNSFHFYEEIRDELEFLMINSGYLESAPFLWIGMVFRYGLKNEIIPHYRRIDKKDGELELSKELDMRILLTADEQDTSLLKEFLEIATLDALIHAGRKYKLAIQALEGRRNQLGNIPDWKYDMDELPQLMIQCYQESKPLKSTLS